jgi:hypothetical protein
LFLALFIQEETVAAWPTAEYFRERRRRAGIIPKEDTYLYTERVKRRGAELRSLERLPLNDWPRDSRGNMLTLEQIMALDRPNGKKVRAEDKCSWEPCPNEHRCRYHLPPQRNPHGSGFQAIKYFCSDPCLTSHIRLHGR